MISEIRKEAKAYAFRNDGYGYDLNTCEDIFSDGAEWAINKACEWWKENLITPTMTKEGWLWFNNKVNAYRRAMKGDDE